MNSVCVLFVTALLLVTVTSTPDDSTAKRCIRGIHMLTFFCPFLDYLYDVLVASIMTEFGDGSTPESCMGCDPALPTCAVGCQNLVDAMYRHCDGVCLPDGYYHDPS